MNALQYVMFGWSLPFWVSPVLTFFIELFSWLLSDGLLRWL